MGCSTRPLGLKRSATFVLLTLALLVPRASHAAMSLGGAFAHSPDDINTTNIPGLLTLSGNDATANVTLPFNVTIEGTSYNSIAISTNGWIEFGGNTSGNSDPTNDCLPTSAHTNPLLAAYWDDDQSFGTNIRYGTVGSSPNRTFVADFQIDVDPANEGNGADDISFQIQIHESSSLISVRYRDSGSTANGQAATIGFQGAGGASADAQPLTCNGKILDDNDDMEGFSVDAQRAGLITLAAIMAHSPDDISGFTSLTGNDATATATLPFNVDIEGTSYNSIAISTNGWIEFGGNTAGNSDSANACLPTSKHTNPFLAGFWDDMQTASTGIRYGAVGTSPNRTYIVDFFLDTVTSGDDGSDDAVFQVEIHEKSNLINIKHRNSQNLAGGQTATVGFQGAGGSSAAAYPLTCNGKLLDDNAGSQEGWSIHAKSNRSLTLHAVTAHSPDDISGFTTLSGNDSTATPTLPFSVVIEGTSYNTVAISTNGWLELGGNTAGNSDPANSCLPTANHSHPFLAAYWDDMQTVNTGVRYGTVGSSPNRIFIVDYDIETVASDDNGSDDATFQVQIHEGSNVINVKYVDTQSRADGQLATIGFQTAGGSSATAYPLTCNGKILDDNQPINGWSVSPLPVCGNGITETKEQCDDGNTSNGDCCSSTCQYEANGASCTTDGNLCTTDVCNATGTCLHNNNTVACDDNAFCNGSDTCSGGSCSVHSGNPCPGHDAGPSCNDSCNEAADQCNGSDAGGVSCTDGLFCTATDVCNGSGTCVGSGNPCPGQNVGPSCNDSCNEASDQCNGNDAGGVGCSDGLFCTATDLCDGGGACVGSGNPCPGQNVGPSCNDSCNEASDQCNDNDAGGVGCSDGLFCTATDLCDGGGACVGSGNPCPGQNVGPNCNDSCNEASDQCNGNDAGGVSCDDGLFCTATDSCNGAGTCAGSGNPCPGNDTGPSCNDSCNEASDQCNGSDASGTSCDDGLYCTASDTCDGSGSCSGAGNPCSGHNVGPNCDDSCDESLDNCSAHDLAGTSCDDGQYCTASDSCDASGACVGSGSPCPGDDQGPSCNDSCDESSDSCTAADANGTNCDDGLFCTATDTCNGSGSCLGSGSPCSGQDIGPGCDDSCDEASDSCSAADADGTSCDDGLFCDGTETCGGGVCGSSGNPCVGADGDANCKESCNEDADNCTADDPNGAACNDANSCTSPDVCTAGVCAGSGACTPTPTATPTPTVPPGVGCPATPLVDCKHPVAPEKAKLAIVVDEESPKKSKLVWKWSKGEVLGNAELGVPGMSTYYALCVYQQGVGLLYAATIPPGAAWTQKGLKLGYKDAAQAQEGVKKIVVAGGISGKAKAAVALSNKLGTMQALNAPPYETLLQSQLINNIGTCLSADFNSPSKNVPGKFTAKGE